jgi:3-hydroxyisobutyrate dehydrogenase
MKIAYLGLGLMGLPMTLRLLKAGFSVTVWNRSREKLAPALAAGALAADTPAQAARSADVVLMCVMDTHAVDAVVFGPEGVALTPGEGKVLIDHSSIRPDATREFAARLKAQNGMDWIDAPVSGGVMGAQEGTLAIMAGGETGAIERVRALLAHYSQQVTRMGPCGSGQATKLCNQVIVTTTIAVIAEAVRLATASGVDAALLPRALAGGWADSKPLQVFVPRMTSGYDQPIGAAYTMLKDLDTALDLARSSVTPMPVAATAAELYRALGARGQGGSDPAELVKLYR